MVVEVGEVVEVRENKNQHKQPPFDKFKFKRKIRPTIKCGNA